MLKDYVSVGGTWRQPKDSACGTKSVKVVARVVVPGRSSYFLIMVYIAVTEVEIRNSTTNAADWILIRYSFLLFDSIPVA